MKSSKLLAWILLAGLLGYLTGFVGTEIQHYNESTFGASYRQFQHEWLCAPAFPGLLLAERSAGYDWRVDEAWKFRHEVRVWNAVFWALLVAGIASLRVIRDYIRWAKVHRGAAASSNFDY